MAISVHDVDQRPNPLSIHSQAQRFLPVEVRTPFVAVKHQFVSRLNPPDEHRHREPPLPLNGGNGAVISSPEPQPSVLEFHRADNLGCRTAMLHLLQIEVGAVGDVKPVFSVHGFLRF